MGSSTETLRRLSTRKKFLTLFFSLPKISTQYRQPDKIWDSNFIGNENSHWSQRRGKHFFFKSAENLHNLFFFFLENAHTFISADDERRKVWRKVKSDWGNKHFPMEKMLLIFIILLLLSDFIHIRLSSFGGSNFMDFRLLLGYLSGSRVDRGGMEGAVKDTEICIITKLLPFSAPFLTVFSSK